jgi:hypothetical protein
MKVGDAVRVAAKGSTEQLAWVEQLVEGYFMYRFISDDVKGVTTGFAALSQEGICWWKCDSADVRAFLTSLALLKSGTV